jgi:hypothetical protein
LEIHAPNGPVSNWREFIVHISIVTVGILIAFSFEGIREAWHQHVLLRDTQANFRTEIAANQDHLRRELVNVKDTEKVLDNLIADFPKLANNSAELHKRVAEIRPAFYFFSATSWQTALSTGALAHMSTEEVDRYANLYLSTNNYSSMENQTVPIWLSVLSFVNSHDRLSGQDLSTARERLQQLRLQEGILEHLAGELQDAIDDAKKNQ